MNPLILLYPLYLAAYLAVVILRYPLAPLAVWLWSTPDRRNLAPWLWWLETIDNDLGGDSGWRDEHLVGTDLLSWLNRTRWLWRNGGNAFNYAVIGIQSGDPRGIMFRRFLKLAESRYLELWFGWAIKGPQHGLCKFVFTIRLRSKAE
jgi:hypothetical protein